MKKLSAILIAVSMILSCAACGNKPSETVESSSVSGNDQNQTAQGGSTASKDVETDKAKLEEAVTCKVDRDGHIVITVRTSANIKKDSGWLGICPMGAYLTEEDADAADVYYEYLDPSYEKEWSDGIYTFVLNADNITPDTYTMVLCDDDDSGNVIGEWIFDMRKNGNIEIGFNDSWLKGA